MTQLRKCSKNSILIDYKSKQLVMHSNFSELMILFNKSLEEHEWTHNVSEF